MDEVKELIDELRMRLPSIEGILIVSPEGHPVAYVEDDERKRENLKDIETALLDFAESALERFDGGSPLEVIVRGEKKTFLISKLPDSPTILVIFDNKANVGLLKHEISKVLKKLKAQKFEEEKALEEYINKLGEDEINKFLEEFKIDEESEGAQ